MFVDADTNQDGLVSRASFSKLIDMAVVLPRLYGYAPADADLYKTTEEKVAARTKMFDSMDTKASGVITFDEGLKFALEHIAGKVAGLDPHPILDHGDKTQFTTFVKKAVITGTAEHTELYWYLLEMFLDHDTNRDGNVTMGHFVEMRPRRPRCVRKCSKSTIPEETETWPLTNFWPRRPRCVRKCSKSTIPEET